MWLRQDELAVGAEARLRELGLIVPPAVRLPGGVVLPFVVVRVVGLRAVISGHGPQSPDGTLAGPLGKVGRDVSPAEARASARLVALSMLGSLRRELGSLDRIGAWVRVHGMVNAAPVFTDLPGVINGFSAVILEVFGPAIGQHARSAVGLAELPWNIPVEVEAIRQGYQKEAAICLPAEHSPPRNESLPTCCSIAPDHVLAA